MRAKGWRKRRLSPRHTIKTTSSTGCPAILPTGSIPANPQSAVHSLSNERWARVPCHHVIMFLAV